MRSRLDWRRAFVHQFAFATRSLFQPGSVARRSRRRVLVAAGLFAQLDPAKLSSGVFRHGRASQDARTKVLYFKDGKTATISLVDVGGMVSIATNGKPDAAIKMVGEVAAPDEVTMVMAAALPIALHPNPARVANIGIGSGLTSQVLLANDVVRELDTIEIEPVMAHAAELGFMPRVARTFRDPRSHIYFEDAKTFLQFTRRSTTSSFRSPPIPGSAGSRACSPTSSTARSRGISSPTACWCSGYKFTRRTWISSCP